jgi:hypothetical protein
MLNDLTPIQLALIRDSLGQAGSEQGAMLAGGLRLGALDVPAGVGDILMEGSIRKSTPITAALTSSVEPSIASGSWQPLPMDTVRWDTDSMADLAAQSNRLTIRTPGIYLLFARASFYANATGVRYIGIVLNNSYYLVVGQCPTNPANLANLNAAALWWCNQGDTLDLQVYQNSGAPLSLSSAVAGRPDFAIARIA